MSSLEASRVRRRMLGLRTMLKATHTQRANHQARDLRKDFADIGSRVLGLSAYLRYLTLHVREPPVLDASRKRRGDTTPRIWHPSWTFMANSEQSGCTEGPLPQNTGGLSIVGFPSDSPYTTHIPRRSCNPAHDANPHYRQMARHMPGSVTSSPVLPLSSTRLRRGLDSFPYTYTCKHTRYT